MPNVIFTAPEVGTAGLSEDDAKKQNRAIKTGKYRFARRVKALAAGETTGFVKWIAEAAALIRAGQIVKELGRTIHAHPTFSESWMEAAHALHGECLHAPPKRRYLLAAKGRKINDGLVGNEKPERLAYDNPG